MGRLDTDNTLSPRRFYNPPPGNPPPAGAPPDAIRMDFARRLQSALVQKGWTQSELARRVAPLLKNSRLGRDNISKYVRGKVLPLPPALNAIARVLDLDVTELLPQGRAPSAVESERPPFEIKTLEEGEMAWIHLSMALPFTTCLEIRRLVREALGQQEEKK
jgi:transcriptional regulator with XRE-family HTH domain